MSFGMENLQQSSFLEYLVVSATLKGMMIRFIILRAFKGIFIGYSQNNKGYRCYHKNTKKDFDCIHVKVDEYVESKVS